MEAVVQNKPLSIEAYGAIRLTNVPEDFNRSNLAQIMHYNSNFYFAVDFKKDVNYERLSYQALAFKPHLTNGELS